MEERSKHHPAQDEQERQRQSKVLRMIARRYYPVFRAAGLPHEDAEEVVGNVAYKFLKNQHKILKSANAFLNQIASHELKSYIRKNSALKRSNIRTVEDPNQLEIFGQKQFQTSEAKLTFEDVLSILTPRQQEIVKLLLAGYSQVEIAVEIDVKPSTVFYHIQRLKNSEFLRDLLGVNVNQRNKEGDRDQQTDDR